MNRKPLKTLVVLLLATVLVFGSVIAAAAQSDYAVDAPACEGDAVTGTVVATDPETNVVVVYTEDGLCSLDLGGEFDATVSSLLGVYFDGISLDLLNGSMEPAEWSLVYDEATDTWSLPEEGAETTAVNVASVEDNGDGTYTVMFFAPDSDVPMTLVIDDADAAAALMAQLDELAFFLIERIKHPLHLFGELGHLGGRRRGRCRIERGLTVSARRRSNFAVDAKLVLGCAMGGRSMRACELLASDGYTDLINMHGGYDGYREPTAEFIDKRLT